MVECTFCGSNDIDRVTLKANKRKLAICNECSLIYDVDDDGNPIFGHDPKDVEYFKNLEKVFESWDNVENIEPYN